MKKDIDYILEAMPKYEEIQKELEKVESVIEEIRKSRTEEDEEVWMRQIKIVDPELLVKFEGALENARKLREYTIEVSKKILDIFGRVENQININRQLEDEIRQNVEMYLSKLSVHRQTTVKSFINSELNPKPLSKRIALLKLLEKNLSALITE